GRQLRLQDCDRAVRRLRRQRRTSVRVARGPPRGPDRRRGQRDPGPRLRPHLREGGRSGPRARRALAGGAGSRRSGHGALKRWPVALAVVAAFLAATAVLFVFPRQDSPRAADVVVVLAGSSGDRLPEGIELVR